MKQSSRQAEINRQLADRRRLMQKRILIGRILLAVWGTAALLNLILLLLSADLRFYLSSTTADLLLALRVLYPDAGWNVPALLGAFAIPLLMGGAAILWKGDSAKLLRDGMFLLLWTDVVFGLFGYFMDPVLLFGTGSNQTAVVIANLAIHGLLIWHISRARRAVISLEVLPESEIEGDPFEEFRKKQTDDQGS